jgi:hypothetical protein
MGFCMGGTLAWGVAVEGAPSVCISYYGSGVPSMIGQIDSVSCPTLFHFGNNDPFLPNEGAPGRGPYLATGSVLAIEPMLTLGTTETKTLDDDWTVVTTDGTRAAHWEHTVAATDDGPRILTL